VEIDARVAGIIIGRSLGCALVFALEALGPCPRFDQAAVDREVLIRQQALGTGLFEDRLEEALRDSALQQPLAVLAEHPVRWAMPEPVTPIAAPVVANVVPT
jgi:hypothetical protein